MRERREMREMRETTANVRESERETELARSLSLSRAAFADALRPRRAAPGPQPHCPGSVLGRDLRSRSVSARTLAPRQSGCARGRGRPRAGPGPG